MQLNPRHFVTMKRSHLRILRVAAIVAVLLNIGFVLAGLKASMEAAYYAGRAVEACGGPDNIP